MNNPNNQLSLRAINQQTVSNFEQAIKNESTISDKFYNEHIWNDGWFKQYWEYHLRTHYEEFLRSNQLFSYQDYGFNNQVACHNLASIRDFALQIEKDVKQALLTQVESLINSQANAYVAVIEAKENLLVNERNRSNSRIEDLETRANSLTCKINQLKTDKKLTEQLLVQANNLIHQLENQDQIQKSELNSKTSALDYAQKEISSLKTQIQEIERFQLQAKLQREQILAQGRTITSQDRVNLQQIQAKYDNLLNHSNSLEESLRNERERVQELISLIKQSEKEFKDYEQIQANSLHSLQDELIVLQTQKALMDNELTALKQQVDSLFTDNASLRETIRELKESLTDYKNKLLVGISRYQTLEADKNALELEIDGLKENHKKREETIAEENERNIQTIGQNALLKNQILELNRDKDNLNQQITDLTNSLQDLQIKYDQSTVSFSFERNHLIAQLQESQNKAYWSKVKLMSVLALDTTRNFLPKKKVLGWDIQQTITNIETALFASEVIGLGQKITWTIFGIFSISIWLFGLWKLTVKLFCLGINLWQKIKGSAQDLKEEIKEDTQAMKDAHDYRRNYSQSDLKKSQNNYQNIPDDDYIVNNKAFAQENPSLIDKSTQPNKKLKKTR